MDRAKNINGDWVSAETAIHGNSYFCPECRDPVHLIQGSKALRDHFRHNPQSTCGYGSGEGERHKRAKDEIFKSLQSVLGANVEKEYKIGGRRADVYFPLPESDQGVAVEYQWSAISAEDLHDRTADYSANGVAVLWMTGGVSAELRRGGMAGRSGLSILPPWMARIGDMYESYAFEPMINGGAVSRIGLSAPIQKIEKIGGEFVQYLDWPSVDVDISKGRVWVTTDHRGHKRILWLPSTVGGGQTVGPKRKMQRAEISTEAGLVYCSRIANESPISPTIPIQPVRMLLTKDQEKAIEEFRESRFREYQRIGTILDQIKQNKGVR